MIYIHDTIAEDIDVVVIWVGILGNSEVDLARDLIVGSSVLGFYCGGRGFTVGASERAAVGLIILLFRFAGGDVVSVFIIELYAVDVVVEIAVCVNVITCSYSSNNCISNILASSPYVNLNFHQLILMVYYQVYNAIAATCCQRFLSLS